MAIVLFANLNTQTSELQGAVVAQLQGMLKCFRVVHLVTWYVGHAPYPSTPGMPRVVYYWPVEYWSQVLRPLQALHSSPETLHDPTLIVNITLNIEATCYALRNKGRPVGARCYQVVFSVTNHAIHSQRNIMTAAYIL